MVSQFPLISSVGLSSTAYHLPTKCRSRFSDQAKSTIHPRNSRGSKQLSYDMKLAYSTPATQQEKIFLFPPLRQVRLRLTTHNNLLEGTLKAGGVVKANKVSTIRVEVIITSLIQQLSDDFNTTTTRPEKG